MQLLLFHLILIRGDIYCWFLSRFFECYSIRLLLIIRLVLEWKLQARNLGACFVLYLNARTGDLGVEVIETFCGHSLISRALSAEVVRWYVFPLRWQLLGCLLGSSSRSLLYSWQLWTVVLTSIGLILFSAWSTKGWGCKVQLNTLFVGY